jgi:hypothetical protein
MHRNFDTYKAFFSKFGNFFQKIKIIEFENQKKKNSKNAKFPTQKNGKKDDSNPIKFQASQTNQRTHRQISRF